MSTEHQKYSTDNQSQAIRQYAQNRGYEIVRTYADEGKSGLSLHGRPSLQKLLNDVESGEADFHALIVYDVSRWGRFQDPDEAASYELRCRRSGVPVHYCAEQFENDGSIGSSIIKTVKRAMAGEYSRELSVKVFAGQANLIRLGFRQGGPAGFGLRRVLVDQEGGIKCTLDRGQHKSITTDRVILAPGPDTEVAIVHDIYRLFLDEKRSEAEIASHLNQRGIKTDVGRPWSRGLVHQILINEKYVGDNVWGRRSYKLKTTRILNAPEDWIRLDSAFAGIIARDVFQDVQEIIQSRSIKLSDEQMLELLRKVLKHRGYLSGLIIDEVEESPSSSVFRSRFGSLLRAYSLVGFSPDRDYRYLEINQRLRQMHPSVTDFVVKGIEDVGGCAVQNPATGILTINNEFTVSIIIARCFQTSSAALRWKLRFDEKLKPDITLAVRMDTDNVRQSDYYVLPQFDMHEAFIRLAEYNGLSFDAYHFTTLKPFFQMAARSAWKAVG